MCHKQKHTRRGCPHPINRGTKGLKCHYNNFLREKRNSAPGGDNFLFFPNRPQYERLVSTHNSEFRRVESIAMRTSRRNSDYSIASAKLNDHYKSIKGNTKLYQPELCLQCSLLHVYLIHIPVLT